MGSASRIAFCALVSLVISVGIGRFSHLDVADCLRRWQGNRVCDSDGCEQRGHEGDELHDGSGEELAS